MKQGFTLVELLVAMVVFLTVITAAFNLFVNGFKQQSDLLDLVETLNSASYSGDYMARALRMAQKDMSGACVGVAKNNFVNPGGNSEVINFINYQGKCQQFALSAGKVIVRKSNDGTAVGLNAGAPLTLSVLVIEKLEFRIIGASQNDNLQPKITFVLKARKPNSEFGVLSFQTTISQRQLDIYY